MGFCFGVSGAIDICHEVLKKEDIKKNNIYILGMLVHNEKVVQELSDLGFTILHEKDVLEKKDSLHEGDIVVIRAHGTTKEVYCLLNERKVKIYDATCIFVTKIRKKLEEMEKKGYNVLFIGDENHPEVRGIISFGEKTQVLNDINELKNFKIDKEKKYSLLTQTTLNTKMLKEIRDYIDSNFTNIEIANKVCGATQVRQEAVEELAKIVDIVIVVGGKKSSNTKKLYDIAKLYNEDTYLIQEASDIDVSWFRNKKKIGITAGASTPEEIVINIENNIRGIFNV